MAVQVYLAGPFCMKNQEIRVQRWGQHGNPVSLASSGEMRAVAENGCTLQCAVARGAGLSLLVSRPQLSGPGDAILCHVPVEEATVPSVADGPRGQRRLALEATEVSRLCNTSWLSWAQGKAAPAVVGHSSS